MPQQAHPPDAHPFAPLGSVPREVPEERVMGERAGQHRRKWPDVIRDGEADLGHDAPIVRLAAARILAAWRCTSSRTLPTLTPR